ncbi:MAG: hypothetical protein WB791_03505 [Waddliaceae bacterium]
MTNIPPDTSLLRINVQPQDFQQSAGKEDVSSKGMNSPPALKEKTSARERYKNWLKDSNLSPEKVETLFPEKIGKKIRGALESLKKNQMK